MFKFTKSVKLNGFTLIIPSVSVGNVGQLTVDLMIQNLKMEKIGSIFHDCLIPMIGAPCFEFDQDASTACEMYISEEKKLLVFQIRTPLTAALVQDFYQQIVGFIKRESIIKLVLLTSCFSCEQKIMIGMNLCEFMQNDKFKSENQVNLSEDWILREDENLFGKGFSLKLFKFATENDISCVNFIIYVNEGDNSCEAEIFLIRLNKFLQILPTSEKGQLNIQIPQSWKYLFGNENTVDVY